MSPFTTQHPHRKQHRGTLPGSRPCSVREVYPHVMAAMNTCSVRSASALHFRLEAARATAFVVVLLSVRCSALSSPASSGTVRFAKTSSPHTRGLGWLGHGRSVGELWCLRCFAAHIGSSLKRNSMFPQPNVCCSLNKYKQQKIMYARTSYHMTDHTEWTSC